MVIHNRSTGYWWWGAVVMAAVAGCSPGERASLSGEVRYLGVPIATGGIRLFPAVGTPGRGAIAKVVDGKYTILAGEGLFAGNYRVELFAERPTGRKIKPPEGEPGPKDPVDEYESYLPDIYGVASILKIELKPGENVRHFDLLKDGEKQP